MTRAFGFDGDSAAYESLEKKVLADEAAKRLAADTAERERRASLGLPAEDEHMTKKERRKSREAAAAEPGRKKSIGEKVANFVFNGGRRTKQQRWGEERVGDSKGGIIREGRGEPMHAQPAEVRGLVPERERGEVVR